jgi:hypothetical protein
MKGVLLLMSYGLFVWLLLVVWALLPASALAFQATQYARVVAQAEQIAYIAAQRTALATSIASTAMTSSPTSLLVRMVTGPVGWAALGVSAGLVIANMYYASGDLAAIKQAATPGGGYSITTPSTGTFLVPSTAYNGQNASFRGNATYVPGGVGLHPDCVGDGNVYDWSIGPFDVASYAAAPQVGALRGYPAPSPNGHVVVCHFAGSGGSYAAQQGQVTQTIVQNFITNLPASDPRAPESHTAPQGQGKSDPVTEPNPHTENKPVSPGDMPTTVKQKPVSGQDALVTDNVPPPQGTPQPQTQQQTATRLETTNPDGSKTDTETATVSCTTPDHEPRTFASVLQAHQATWTTSGLLGAVALLKTLVWPTTLPTISLPSQVFGTQTLNFNDWAWVFTALRTIVIAIATLASYRIIFVGGR